MSDIQFTAEERELNDRVREIMETERDREVLPIRERIREQILESEKRMERE